MEIKIDHNIPIPIGSGSGFPILEVLGMLKIGDSFIYPGHTRGPIYRAAIKFGIVVKIRMSTTGSGWRVWRIK